MLVNVLGIEKGRDETTDLIASHRHSPIPEQVLPGIYQIGHWNFDDMLRNIGHEVNHLPLILMRDKDHCILEGESVPFYGVCDSPDQFWARYQTSLDIPNRNFVVAMVRLDKKTEPAEGGWRWRKWGQYVGNQEPTTQYLHDEPLIETVYTFHIYELLNVRK